MMNNIRKQQAMMIPYQALDRRKRGIDTSRTRTNQINSQAIKLAPLSGVELARLMKQLVKRVIIFCNVNALLSTIHFQCVWRI